MNENPENNQWLTALMYLLIWIKILTYLAVFQAIRYFVKMINEIIKEIGTFLVILALAMVSYC